MDIVDVGLLTGGRLREVCLTGFLTAWGVPRTRLERIVRQVNQEVIEC